MVLTSLSDHSAQCLMDCFISCTTRLISPEIESGYNAISLQVINNIVRMWSPKTLLSVMTGAYRHPYTNRSICPSLSARRMSPAHI
ncbi:unnamed protein product, partial [Ceratitis capitata]